MKPVLVAILIAIRNNRINSLLRKSNIVNN